MVIKLEIPIKFVSNDDERVESVRIFNDELILDEPVNEELRAPIREAIKLILKIGLEITQGLTFDDFQEFYEGLTEKQKQFVNLLNKYDDISSDDLDFQGSALAGVLKGLNTWIEKSEVPNFYESEWNGGKNTYWIKKKYKFKIRGFLSNRN